MEEQDSFGVSSEENSKIVAVQEDGLVQPDDEPVAQSREGTGLSWESSSAEEMPALFGAGGWQDGGTAFIHCARNKQIEDAIALSGQGERVIDENEHQYNIANVNEEFSYSQFKCGALSFQDYEPRFKIGQGYLSAGDFSLHASPLSNAYDETMQALGDIVQPVYKLDGFSAADSSTDVRLNVNPFKRNAPDKPTEGEAQGFGMVKSNGEEDDETDDYYYADGLFDPSAAEAVNRNFDSGLRRQNTRVHQSRLLERQTEAADIMGAVNQAQESYANVLKEHFKDAYMDADEKERVTSMLHTSTSKYTSEQQGVGEVSRSLAKSYKKQRGNGPNKLNTHLVGV